MALVSNIQELPRDSRSVSSYMRCARIQLDAILNASQSFTLSVSRTSACKLDTLFYSKPSLNIRCDTVLTAVVFALQSYTW